MLAPARLSCKNSLLQLGFGVLACSRARVRARLRARRISFYGKPQQGEQYQSLDRT